MPHHIDPAAYRAWFSTALGRRVDADEKAVVLALAQLRAGEQVLDVGCGDGNYTGPAAELTGSAVGLDRSPDMLRAAALRLAHLPGIRWIEGDATRLPFADASFDVVLVVTVLCFVADRHAVIREAHRVLRPGGRLVVAELGRYSPWALERRLRGLAGSRTWRHAHFFSRHELESLLGDAGFTDLAHGAAVFYPPLRIPARGAIEWLGRWLWPWAGALQIVRGRRGAARRFERRFDP